MADADIVHVYKYAIAWVELGDDPRRLLVGGPDRAGNLVELVVLDRIEGPLVIHAMPLRRSTEKALFGEEHP